MRGQYRQETHFRPRVYHAVRLILVGTILLVPIGTKLLQLPFFLVIVKNT